ncbi:MAG TPA: hypothetical protein VL995_14390 [Cellvibrio sp.]|nr:hypothetical protein [Cellvibrio sp.]
MAVSGIVVSTLLIGAYTVFLLMGLLMMLVDQRLEKDRPDH